MVRLGALFERDGHERRQVLESMQSLLPTHNSDDFRPPIDPKEVTLIALRLRHQIESIIPCELDEERITQAHSSIITPAVLATAKAAGDMQNRACVVFCLIIVKKWFRRQARIELWDAEMHDVRAVACEVIAKQIIESEEDPDFLMQEVLLKRYSILLDGEPTTPVNVIEKAVDLHALRVIGSSGYQKAISYLWKGWLIQDENDPSTFIAYKEKANPSYWIHLDPDRMRTPMYQNALQVIFSVIFLGFYTGAINTVNPTGDLDIVEGFLYIFTLGFVCDELTKFWKVGRYYLSFWNVFNSGLYALLVTSFILRMIALGHALHTEGRDKYNTLSYNFLALSAPMFWGRLLLYFDTQRFFGTMMVVLKVMMRESIIFFALLFVVCVGFLQAFIGLDQVDEELTEVGTIVIAMLNTIMTSPEFDTFQSSISPPFGLILYYIYNFVIMVVLLNILIALYNSAYEDITSAAVDEYMALFATKTLQFVRAPDENVFIPPLNLIEIFGLIIPLEWWMKKETYERLNDYVMATIYSPLLLVTAAYEVRNAKRVRLNARRGAEEDADAPEEWEQLGDSCDFEADGWDKRVQASLPNVENDPVKEVKELRKQMEELRSLVLQLLDGKEGRAGQVSMSTSTLKALPFTEERDGEGAVEGEGKGRYPTPEEE